MFFTGLKYSQPFNSTSFCRWKNGPTWPVRDWSWPKRLFGLRIKPPILKLQLNRRQRQKQLPRHRQTLNSRVGVLGANGTNLFSSNAVGDSHRATWPNPTIAIHIKNHTVQDSRTGEGLQMWHGCRGVPIHWHTSFAEVAWKKD